MIRNLRIFISIAVLSCSSYAAIAQAPSNEEVNAKANEYMTAAEKVDKFSGSVLIARDGKPMFSKGYGMANYEWNIPNTPETVFRVGSITKQFTSAAIMLLQERGKLSTSDPICKYVTECPAAWEPITIKQVLTHTSGIPNYTSFPGWMDKKSVLPITTAELLAEYKSKPLDFTPGEKFSYSNSGYHLLGAIIEKVSGRTYTDFLQENIFTPLGLKQTGYDMPKPLIKFRAAGYSREGDGLVNAAYLDMLIPYAAGSIYSTTLDLLTWEQALYGDKLLTAKSREEMFMPFKSGYAYGWGVGKQLEHNSMSHSGGIYGFSAYIVRFPDDKLTVVVLSNVQNMGSQKIANALSAIVFGVKYDLPRERKAITLPANILEQYVGDYDLSPSLRVSVTLENGNLMFKVPSQPAFQLYAESETVFFLKVADAQVTFVKDGTGKVTQLLFAQGGGRGQPASKVIK
jgi:CubicO group peptidase (beta-lactamase class C family)